MSASIMWRPVAKTDKTLDGVWAPSTFIKAMEEAFGTMPIRLSDSHLSMLRAMAAVHGEGEHNPYRELIDIIERLDGAEIEIWAEY